MWAAYLTGIDNLLMAIAAEPDFAATLFDLVAGLNEKICRNAVRAGADIILLGDDYASNLGPFFSPSHFDTLIKPQLARVITAIHEEGGLAIKHSDGNIWSLMDSIVEAGADAINPLEPVAGMDIGRAKREYGDRVCLVGNIDCGELLSNGSEEDVEASVRQCIEDAAGGGGFILSSSNSIHSSVKPENFVAMIRAGKKYGSYPVPH
jgi:uroporphyrinogen decarboxylase